MLMCRRLTRGSGLISLMLEDVLLFLPKCVFSRSFFLLEGFSLFFFFYKDRVSFLPLILYVRDSSGYLETSLLPFLIREKGNDPDIYKDSRYLLTGLNPTLALIPS